MKNLRRIQRARLLFALGLVANVVGFVALVSLVPSLLAVRLGPHAPSVAKVAKTATSSLAISEAQNLVSVLSPLISTTSPIEAIRSALAQKPVGIQIDRIEYSKSGSVGTIVLGTITKNASDVETYRVRLATDTHFSKVNVPVSALAGATNGRFAITLTGQF